MRAVFVTIFACAISISQGAIKNQADVDAHHQKALIKLQNVLEGNSADTSIIPDAHRVSQLYNVNNPQHVEALREFNEKIKEIPQEMMHGDVQTADNKEKDGPVDENDMAELDSFLEEITGDMKAVMGNDEARDLLDKVLDETNVLIETEDAHKSLERINGAVNQASELLRHKDSRDLAMTCMNHLETFFVDKNVHDQVEGLVDTTYKFAMDPDLIKLKEEALTAMESLMDDDVGKAHLALAVVHMFRTVQHMDPMNLALDGMKGLNQLVSNEFARSMILSTLGTTAAARRFF